MSQPLLIDGEGQKSDGMPGARARAAGDGQKRKQNRKTPKRGLAAKEREGLATGKARAPTQPKNQPPNY